MPVQTSHGGLPPFPDNVKTAPLLSLSLAKLETDDMVESEAFFNASKQLGFFYLNMFGSKLGESIVAEAEQLNRLQKEFFKLPNEVKDIYGRPHLDPFYAYRFGETSLQDEDGKPLRGFQNYNLRKDDILGIRPRLACHQIILDHQTLLESYVRHCRAAVDILLEHLNTHLQLSPGTLAKLHRISEPSGDHVRFTQSPPQPWDEQLVRKAEHTDFGSLTILFNWVGGLQIRTPDTHEWVYVKPVPGSCVVNLGDAMVTFTAGILRSNIHRVVPPPGEQASLTRNSLVFFTRPEDAVTMKRLTGGLIDAQPPSEQSVEEMTAEEWILKRGTGQMPGVFTAKGFEPAQFVLHTPSRPTALAIKS